MEFHIRTTSDGYAKREVNPISKYLVMHVNMDVYFISSLTENASIKIGVADATRTQFFNSAERFFHLPPFHRLKETPQDVTKALNKSTRHTIIFHHNDGDEPIIRSLDDIDLMPFWNILFGKLVCIFTSKYRLIL